MNQQSFDILTRSLSGSPSRRQLLRGLVSMGFGLGAMRLSGIAKARKKRKPKKKTKGAKPNAFGCLEVGDPCKKSDQCCSGICDGKKGKRKCLAHGAGTCAQDGVGYCSAANPTALTCNNDDFCFCLETTAGSIFCADVHIGTGITCTNCQRDADCVALGFPPGSACAPFSTGICEGGCFSEMVCVAPCGAELPEPTE